jgi:hypothetical protein
MQLIAIIFVEIFPYIRDGRNSKFIQSAPKNKKPKARYQDKHLRHILEDKLVCGEGPLRI